MGRRCVFNPVTKKNNRRLISRIKINNPSPLENLPPLKMSIIKYHKQWKKTAGRGSWLEFSNRNEYLTVKNACKFSHLKMPWVSEGKENDILYLCWWRHLLSSIRGGLKKFMLKNKDMICLLSVNACVFETTEKFAHAGKAFFLSLGWSEHCTEHKASLWPWFIHNNKLKP